MKAFIESQFGYCPLILVFHIRDDNKKIAIYMSNRYKLSI